MRLMVGLFDRWVRPWWVLAAWGCALLLALSLLFEALWGPLHGICAWLVGGIGVALGVFASAVALLWIPPVLWAIKSPRARARAIHAALFPFLYHTVADGSNFSFSKGSFLENACENGNNRITASYPCRVLPNIHQFLRLSIIKARIVALPTPLHIFSHLTIEGTYLAHLPPDLTVNGDVILDRVPLRQLPSNWSVGGLILIETRVRHMPDGLCTERSCQISGNTTTLGSRMHVGGDLDLSGSLVKRLPLDLVVDGCILPPETLVDLRALRLTLTTPIVLTPAVSHHDRLALAHKFSKYPDVLRVLQSQKQPWTIDPLRFTEAPGAVLSQHVRRLLRPNR